MGLLFVNRIKSKQWQLIHAGAKAEVSKKETHLVLFLLHLKLRERVPAGVIKLEKRHSGRIRQSTLLEECNVYIFVYMKNI